MATKGKTIVVKKLIFENASEQSVAAGGGSSSFFDDDGTTASPLPTAVGSKSIAIGQGAIAAGNNSFAIGTSAESTAADSIAMGRLTRVTGISGSIAIGTFGLHTQDQSIQIGSGSQVNGVLGVALGVSSTAAYRSVSIGSSASASSNNCVAIGRSANASGNYSIAIGLSSVASSGGCIAIRGSATNFHAIAIGLSSSTTGNRAVAIGSSATAPGTYGVAIGYGATCGTTGFAIGRGANNNATNAGALGHYAISRIVNTIQVQATSIIRKDEAAVLQATTSAFRWCAGNEAIVFTKEVVLDSIVTPVTLTVPTNSRFYPVEVGVILSSGSLTVGPTVSFGTNINTTKFLVATLTTIAAQFDRNAFAVASSNGEATLEVNVTVAGTGTTPKGRFYFKGMLVENQ